MSTSTTTKIDLSKAKAYVALASTFTGGLALLLTQTFPDSAEVKLISGLVVGVLTVLGSTLAVYRVPNVTSTTTTVDKVDPDVAESNDDGYDGPRTDGPPPSGGFPLAG